MHWVECKSLQLVIALQNYANNLYSQTIERDHKQIPLCKKGQPSVAIKIEGPNQPMYGRQLEEKDVLYSLVSRQSIDVLKEFYRSDVSNDEWALMKKLKGVFDIV